ncbi:MAG: Peptidyl-prolyl cis-trans isomerase D [Alphaproteobacteria bacterium MarineAlpha9_Bin4]|nr:hypothetical protein [Pelagibacterales bacterium]PPR27619.1 MAG: Peptidyl-prolyl cis-trans isomerase D [Alphaproteobacteria bacterium MarineAlpha9_Bin4]
MIKSLGKTFKSLSSKFLIIIIALSFAVWGIGDIFIPNSNNPTIAKVGGTDIKLNEFQLDYQLLVDRLRQTSNQPITEEFLKAIGLHNNVVDSLITKKYINFLAKDLKLNIGDKYVKKAIINNPLFNDQLGVFSKDYFNYYLNRNNLKEKDIYNITKDAISNDLLVKSITHSEFLPLKIASSLLKKRDTARKAKIFTFDTTGMIIADKKVDDNAIKKKYETIKANYLTPETRNIKVVTFSYDAQKKAINISDTELNKFYQDNINLYRTEETRETYMVQFKSDAQINNFIKSISNTNSFFENLKEYQIGKENSFLGDLKKSDLDAESQSIVFNLPVNKVSKVIKTSFGFKIFYVQKINKEQIRSFESVKEKIKQDIITERANEKIYNKANIFYENFLKTANFKQSLENLELKVNNINDVGLDDVSEIKELKLLGLKNNDLTRIIFNLKSNDISEIIEDKSNNLYYIYLSKINPSKIKKFEEVKNDIQNLIYDEERDKVAKKLAEEFKKKYSEKNTKELSKSNFFSSKTTDWITYDNRLGKDISSEVKELIFTNKLNNLSNIITPKTASYIIVLPIEQSQSILKEDQQSNISNITTELNNSLENDLNNAILYDLSKIYKSNINQKFLESF